MIWKENEWGATSLELSWLVEGNVLSGAEVVGDLEGREVDGDLESLEVIGDLEGEVVGDFDSHVVGEFVGFLPRVRGGRSLWRN